jgi:hypothetical protein
MPLSISCPACERTLRVPETLLGQAVKCPGCSHRFTAPEQGEESAPKRPASSNVRTTPRPMAPPLEDEEPPSRGKDRIIDRPRSRRDRDDDYDDEDNRREPSARNLKDAWNKVRIGINLVMIGIWVWLGGSVLAGMGVLIGALFMGGTLMSNPSGQTAVTSLGFAGILMILSVGLYYLCVLAEFVLRLIGYGMCMAAPPLRDSGMKPLAITAFSLSAVQVLFWCGSFVVGGMNGFATSALNRSRGLSASTDLAGSSISGLSALCAIGSFVVFLFFLRSVCNNARARDLAGKPIAILVASICFWVISVLLLVAVFCAGFGVAASAVQSQSTKNLGAQMGAWAIILGILVVVFGLIYLGLQVWYITILQKIRDAVASHRRRL